MAPRSKKSRYLLTLMLGVGILGIGSAAVALIRGFLSGSSAPPKQVVQQIQLIRPPPPPPDLPPPPPPPPEEHINIPQPDQPPDPTPTNEPPPSQQLGLDTEGGAGGDAFGLLGNKGGRDITAGGGGAFSWYAGLLKNEILDQLSEDKVVRSGSYRVTVRAWMREDGSVARIEIVKGSGDAQRDHAIEMDLQRVKRLPQPPPTGMPDSISFEVVGHG